jgi:hypothetical protein
VNDPRVHAPSIPRTAWILLAVGLTVLFEAMTLGLRLGAGLQSPVATAGLASFTLGLRIHHGYVGLAILASAPLWRAKFPGSWDRLSAVGVGLVLSDALHHLVALWALTGSPSFDLFYPCH